MRFYFLIVFFVLTTVSIKSQSLELLNPLPSFHTGHDVHFTSSSHGFVVNNQELIETTDAGETWTIKQNIDSGVEIEFHNGKGFIVGENGYVLQSNDSGNNWTSIDIGASTLLNSINFINEDIIIISGETELFKTVDGGQNWSALIAPTEIMTKTFFTSELVGHAACKDGFVFKTVDGGQNWYITNSSTTSPSDYFTIYFYNSQIGYASREHSEFYKTTDGGETWVEDPNIIDGILDIEFATEDLGYIVGEGGAMFRTSNGGDTWTWNSVVPVRKGFSDVLGIHLIDNNTGYVTGQRGRIAKKTNATGWNSYSPTYDPIRKLQFVSGNVAYAVNYDKFIKTTDGGQSWFNIGFIVPSVHINHFEFLTENIGYAVLSRSVFKTTDGGLTWIETNNGNQVLLDDISSIDFIDENTGYVTASSGLEKLMKTTDGGNTYEQINSDGFHRIQFINNSIGFAHKDYGNNTLYKTVDGGVTWEEMTSTGSFLNIFYFVDENIGFYGGDNNLIGRTLDGGETWQGLGGLPSTDIENIRFFNENEGYVSDDYGWLYKTTDGGQNWEQLVTIGDINSIDLFGTNVYIAGAWGRIMGTTNPLSTLDIQHSGNEVILYPNPASSIVKLQSVTNNLIQNVTFFDITGKEIQSFSNKTNVSIIEIPIDKLSNQLLLVKIQLDNGTILYQKLMVN